MRSMRPRNHEFRISEYTLKAMLKLDQRQSLVTKAGYYKEDSHVSETGLGVLEYEQDKF